MKTLENSKRWLTALLYEIARVHTVYESLENELPLPAPMNPAEFQNFSQTHWPKMTISLDEKLWANLQSTHEIVVGRARQGYANLKSGIPSIFNEVLVSNENAPALFWQGEDIFSLRTKDPASKESLFSQLTPLMNAIQQLQENEPDLIHLRLWALVKEYLTVIPYVDNEKMLGTWSQYEFIKLVMATAQILDQVGDVPHKFILLEYDISGIQDYIFQITEGRTPKKRVAKALRTRSFYLNMLSDMMAYAVLQRFNLFEESILFSSGGRGMVLIPNLGTTFDEQKVGDETRRRMTSLIHDVEHSLFWKHQAKISFSFFGAVLNREQVYQINISSMAELKDRVQFSNKAQKFSSVLSQAPFQPVLPRMKETCSLCEIHEGTHELHDDSGAIERLCDFCFDSLEMNTFLTNHQKFVVEFAFGDQWMGSPSFSISLNGLGKMGFYPLNSPLKGQPTSYALTINDSRYGEIKFNAFVNAKGKAFDEIAEESSGDKKLAILKMDVDSLGSIFNKGFAKEYSTIGRKLALSRLMDYFFTYKLGQLAKLPEYQQAIYIIYSGGDDLAIVLPASQAISFAYLISREFSEYSHNSEVHISGGISIFSPKVPLRYEILGAEEMLEKSKSFELSTGTGKSKKKNALTLLEATVANPEIPNVLKEIDYFEKAYSKNLFSRSGIYNLYTILLNATESRPGDHYFTRHIPWLAYSFRRNIKDEGLLERMKKLFIQRDVKMQTIEMYKIVFAMVLMLTRKAKEEEHE